MNVKKRHKDAHVMAFTAKRMARPANLDDLPVGRAHPYPIIFRRFPFRIPEKPGDQSRANQKENACRRPKDEGKHPESETGKNGFAPFRG
jgi:hypothetical protein